MRIALRHSNSILGVILSGAVFPAERRISLHAGLASRDPSSRR